MSIIRDGFEKQLKQYPIKRNRSSSPEKNQKEKTATKTTSLEVIFGPGIKGTMVICKGEKPSEIAKKFAHKYNLDRSAEILLKGLLISEMDKAAEEDYELNF